MARPKTNIMGLVDQTFVCPLCLAQHEELCSLVCGHTFCKRCLVQRLDGNMLACPDCNRKIDLGDAGAAGLHADTNYLMRNVLPTIRPEEPVVANIPTQLWGSETSYKPTCSAHIDQQAASFCTQCKEHMCVSCARLHQRRNPAKDHYITTVSTDLAAASLPQAKRFCAKHEQEVLDVCCNTCCEAVCCKCITAEHIGHSVTRLQDAIKEIQLLLPSIVNDLKLKEEQVDSIISQVETVSENVEARAKVVSSEVHLSICQSILALEDKEKELLQQIESIRKLKGSVLRSQRDELSQVKAVLGDSGMLIQRAYIAQHSSDLIALKRRLLARVSHVQERLALLKQPHEDDIIGFTIRELPLKSAIAQAGSIVSSAYALHTTISGNGAYSAIVGRQARFAVTCRDHVNSKRSEDINSLDVNIMGPDSRPVSVELLGQSDGFFQFSYFPSTLGAYQISITLRGKHIHGSPMTAKVRSRRNYFAVGNSHHRFGADGEGDGQLCRPWGICCDPRGFIVVADRSNNRVQVFNPEGVFSHKFGSSGNRPGQFDRPAGVALNSLNHIIVADKDNHRIQVFSFEGQFLLAFGEKGFLNGQLHYPWDVAVNSEDCILVSDTRNHRIQLFNTQGQFLNKFSFQGPHHQRMQLPQPRGICFTETGDILVTDFNKHRLMFIRSNFQSVQVIGSEGSGNGQFFRPQGVAVDLEGNILVTEGRNNRVQVFRPDGSFLTKFGMAGNGPNQFDRPSGICVTSDGYIVVVDFGNNRIQIF